MTQWFFFSAMNVKKGQTVTFHICNLYKEESLYNSGMKPFVFSTKANSLQGTKKWKRDGTNISYFRNGKSLAGSSLPPDKYNSKKEKKERQYRSLSTLTFSYTFEYDRDCVFFSHFAPYSYSQLTSFLNSIPSQFPDHEKFLRGNVLCKSLSGVSVPILTVTDRIEDYYSA